MRRYYKVIKTMAMNMMMRKKLTFKSLLILQTFFCLLSSAFAQTGGLIPKDQMDKFCGGSAKKFMDELEKINRNKIQLVQRLTTHVSDSKNVDEIIEKYYAIQKKYVESLAAIESDYGVSTSATAQAQKSFGTIPPFEKSPLNNIASANASAQVLSGNNNFLENHQLPSSPNTLEHFQENSLGIAQLITDSTSQQFTPVNNQPGWWGRSILKGFSAITTKDEKFRALKALSENADKIPTSLKPEVILTLYSQKAPRTTKLLNKHDNIKVIYECINTSNASESCTNLLEEGETLEQLKESLAQEEQSLGKEISTKTGTDEFKNLLANTQKNQLNKETLQESINLIRQQLENESHLKQDASSGVLEEFGKTFAELSPAEKRTYKVKKAISNQSSLFLIVFNDEAFANPENFDDYDFEQKLDTEITKAKEDERYFLQNCIDKEITDATQKPCLELLSKSERKIALLKDNYIKRNTSQINGIKETLNDKEFNAIEDLKKFLVNVYMNSCRSNEVTSKDVLISCEYKGDNHLVISNLFDNTYNIVSKLNTQSLTNAKSLTPETQAVLQNACEYINNANAPSLDQELCTHLRRGGTHDKRREQQEERRIIAMNKAEKEERENHIEYDAKTNRLKKIPKQSWGTIIGRGIVPILPYTINQGMSIFQNKAQTDALLNNGLMQKQLLHNLNYSWRYPINSFTNPFLFGTTNNGLMTLPNFGANTLPTTNVGISNGFNFGN